MTMTPNDLLLYILAAGLGLGADMFILAACLALTKAFFMRGGEGHVE